MFAHLVAVILLGVPAEMQRFRMQVQPERRVECTFELTIDAPNLNTQEWILFAPVPPRLPSQSDVRVSLRPEGHPIRDLSELRRSLLLARVSPASPEQRRGLKVRWTAQVTLHRRRLVPVADDDRLPKVAALTARERKLALGTNGIVDHELPEFRRWLAEAELLRLPGETDLELARRTFLALRTRCSYDFQKEMDRRASQVSTHGKTDCGGHSALFVACLRANGVPARVLIGRWAKSASHGEEINGLVYYQTHVKAEFHCAEIGWVPIDLSLAINAKENADADPLFHFGRDAGDFVTFHVDHDMRVDSIHFGEKLIDGLQGIGYFATGPGDFDKHTTTETWLVKPVPRAASR